MRRDATLRPCSASPWRARVALVCALALVTSALPAWGQGTTQPGTASADPNQKQLIAVLDVQAVGATATMASAMTDRLREEMLKTGRYTLVDRSQMNAVLNEQALQQTGCTSQECAVQVGQVLGVKRIVTGKVTRVEKNLWLLSGMLIDVETAQTLAAESVQYQGPFADLLSGGITLLAAKLSGETPPVEKVVKTPPPEEIPPAVAAQPAAPPETKQKSQEEESGGMGVLGWTLVGVGVVGLAAAASKKSSSSSSTTPCTNCGSVGVSW